MSERFRDIVDLQRELVEVLAGLRNATGGKLVLDGNDITQSTCLERWRLGIGYIPADRISVGSIADFSLVENTTLNYYFDRSYYHQGTLDFRRIRELTEEIITEYGVVAPGPDIAAKSLSGGNLQKLILARVLSRNPRLVIAHLPTQGLDIGATEFVRNKLIDAKQNKACVLLVSEDLDEILEVSDWIAPIYEGTFMGVIPTEEVKREEIGAMMAGIPLEEVRQ